MDEDSQKSAKIILVILVLIVVGITVWYLYNKTVPSESQIESKSEPVIVVEDTILESENVKQLDDLKQNGTLPIIVTDRDRKKNNPFSSF